MITKPARQKIDIEHEKKIAPILDAPPIMPYNLIMTTTNKGATEMNTPKINDRVFCNYGVGCGEAIGTVTDIRRAHPTFDFGNVVEVTFDDGRVDTITRYVGTVELTDGVAIFPTAATPIGTYLVTSEEWTAGTRVEAGNTRDDFDRGVVEAFEHGFATVRWESGVTTDAPASILRRTTSYQTTTERLEELFGEAAA